MAKSEAGECKRYGLAHRTSLFMAFPVVGKLQLWYRAIEESAEVSGVDAAVADLGGWSGARDQNLPIASVAHRWDEVCVRVLEPFIAAWREHLVQAGSES